MVRLDAAVVLRSVTVCVLAELSKTIAPLLVDDVPTVNAFVPVSVALANVGVAVVSIFCGSDKVIVAPPLDTLI
jgi:hypothetical protein